MKRIIAILLGVVISATVMGQVKEAFLQLK